MLGAREGSGREARHATPTGNIRSIAVLSLNSKVYLTQCQHALDLGSCVLDMGL